MERLRFAEVISNAPVHIAVTNINNKYARDMHCHDFAELFIVESGQGTHILPSGEHALKTGDLVFLAADHGHCLKASDMRIMNIAFRKDIQEQCCHISPWLAHKYEQREPVQLRSSLLQRERLAYWSKELQPDRASVAAVQAMLLDLARAEQDLEQQQLGPQWLEEALQQIADPPLLGEGMQALVRLSGRSREYIWRTCKKHYQRNPQELINDLRMRYAERALRLSDDPILHICYDCGLSNISHFYRMFQKQYDMTPKRYRIYHHSAIT